MRALIIAGGKGTRLRGACNDLPKPMVPLAGRPLLEHQLELCKRHGCTHVTIFTGHQAQMIERHFQDGSRWGVQISYHREDRELGTAGCVKSLEAELREDVFVLYGDVMMDVDLEALRAAHRTNGLATLVVHPNDHPFDSDLIEVDRDRRVMALYRTPHPEGDYRNLVNAGLYVLSPRLLRYIPTEGASDFGRDVFPAALKAGEALYAYQTAEYLKDIGTPARYAEVDADVRGGKPARWHRRRLRAAVFLDRDGVINKEVDLLHRVEDFELLPGVPEAIRRLNHSDYLVIVATNQPVIARGLCSEAELDTIHKKMETLLGQAGAYVDGVYYCPHHPERGFPGERPEYRIECDCRKPNLGMLERAARAFHLDLTASVLVGDSTVDIQTGRRAGIRTLLVQTGYAGRDAKAACEPDLVCRDLREAVDRILEGQIR